MRGLMGARKQAPAKEPARLTIPDPNWRPWGFPTGVRNERPAWKQVPQNLRYFSKTPYARRAINAIKNPIAMMPWDIAPVDGVEWNSELERQALAVTNSFNRPNTDDSFRSMTEQWLEDWCCGAAAIEQHVTTDPNHPWWGYPVDGLSIMIYPQWSGRANDPRYCQTQVYGGWPTGQSAIDLLNDELIYGRPNPSTATPFGWGPLETAFKSIANKLGVGEYAGNITSNARPSVAMAMLGAGPDEVLAMRQYWTSTVEGQGIMPILGSSVGADGKPGDYKMIQLTPDGDGALYLKYQEFLKIEIAVAFDLSPQNLGSEQVVNRNVAEVAEDRDWDQAIKPAAVSYEAYLTREAIQGKMGFSQLCFKFRGLDREDEQATADILNKLWISNAITIGEMYAERGLEIDDPERADWRKVDVDLAVMAARGLHQNLDPNVGGSTDLPDVKKDGSAM